MISSATNHSIFTCRKESWSSSCTDRGPAELLPSCFTRCSFSQLLRGIFYPCWNMLSQMCEQHYVWTGSSSISELAEAASYLTVFLYISCIPSRLTKAVSHRIHACNTGLNCQVKSFSSELFVFCAYNYVWKYPCQGLFKYRFEAHIILQFRGSPWMWV